MTSFQPIGVRACPTCYLVPGQFISTIIVGIRMHNVGLNTSVQSWSKPFVWTFTSIFFLAHSFCFFIGLLVAPQLYSSSSIVGKLCHQQNLSFKNGQEHNMKALSNCSQVGKNQVFKFESVKKGPILTFFISDLK